MCLAVLGLGLRRGMFCILRGKKEKRTKIGCTVEEFDKYIAEFEALFTEEERDNWRCTLWWKDRRSLCNGLA